VAAKLRKQFDKDIYRASLAFTISLTCRPSARKPFA
jgi:hypothetical protein